MKYTFLLPAFKATYFREALESIKNQTYTDFKVVVSDDCSPEGTALKQIYDEVVDSRFTFRRNAENMGSKSLVSHWNLLVDLCDTDYLIMASDDDVYEPIFLEEINRLVEKYPDCDLFRGRIRKISARGDMLFKDCLLDERTTHLEFMHHFFKGNIMKCIPQYVFKTSRLTEIGGFFSLPLAWGSDDATVLMMSENGCCHTPSVVFSFRLSGINISCMGNRRVDMEKSRAIYIYIEFLQNFLKSKENVNLSKYEKNLLSGIWQNLKYSTYVSDLWVGAELRNYHEMLPYYHKLDELHCFNGKLEKIHFFWNWLRAYKTR